MLIIGRNKDARVKLNRRGEIMGNLTKEELLKDLAGTINVVRKSVTKSNSYRQMLRSGYLDTIYDIKTLSIPPRL